MMSMIYLMAIGGEVALTSSMRASLTLATTVHQSIVTTIYIYHFAIISSLFSSLLI